MKKEIWTVGLLRGLRLKEISGHHKNVTKMSSPDFEILLGWPKSDEVGYANEAGNYSC